MKETGGVKERSLWIYKEGEKEGEIAKEDEEEEGERVEQRCGKDRKRRKERKGKNGRRQKGKGGGSEDEPRECKRPGEQYTV